MAKLSARGFGHKRAIVMRELMHDNRRLADLLNLMIPVTRCYDGTDTTHYENPDVTTCFQAACRLAKVPSPASKSDTSANLVRPAELQGRHQHPVRRSPLRQTVKTAA